MIKEQKEIQSKFKEEIIKIWETKVLRDYKRGFLLREDTLKIRFCKHIFDVFKDKFFLDNEVRLYSEYTFSNTGMRADLALLDIENDDPLVIIELKYKDLNNRTESKIKEDYDKMLRYKDLYKNCDLFMAVVSGNVDEKACCKSWIKDFKMKTDFRRVRITELLIDETDDGKVETAVFEYR